VRARQIPEVLGGVVLPLPLLVRLPESSPEPLRTSCDSEAMVPTPRRVAVPVPLVAGTSDMGCCLEPPLFD
jgi:hypothetical protein